MGAYCSIHNDTVDETVMVFVGVNTKVLQPILWSITAIATALSGGVAIGSLPASLTISVTSEMTLLISVSTISAVSGGIVSASNFVLEELQTKLVNDLTKGGYVKCLPGQTYTTSKLTPALNLRAWVVRIQRTPNAIIIKRCSASIWSGTKPGSCSVYRVLDKTTFPKWVKHETIPIQYQHVPKETTIVSPPEEEATTVDATSLTDSTMMITKNVNVAKSGDEEENSRVTSSKKPAEEETFTLLDSGMAGVQCKIVESSSSTKKKKKEQHSEEGRDDEDDDNTTDDGSWDDDDAWIQVDAISE